MAKRFHDLVCWQLSREVANAVREVTSRPRIAQDRRFCSEIEDATSSASRNIAEGVARRSRAEFARFLDIALASLAETQSLLADALDRLYVSEEEHREYNLLAIRTAIATRRLAARARQFAREQRQRRRQK